MVKQENLTVFCQTKNMGYSLPSGGLVSAVLYAREDCGAWCQCSAHIKIAVSVVFFFWALIKCGSSSSLSLAVQMASSASCFVLLKPTDGMFLGSHSSRMFRLG